MVLANRFEVLDVGAVSTAQSEALHRDAWQYAPAGVQGDGRYYKPYPLYIRRAKGARLWDLDDNEYIDFHGSYGPAILGYSDDRVNNAVKEVMDSEGVLFALPHPREVELAKIVAEVMPSGEKTIFTNSGTEAVYHAVRVARAFTERDLIVKLEGAYHGWFNDVAVSIKPELEEAGPAAAPHTVPGSAGVPGEYLEKVLVLPYNDLGAIERVLESRRGEIAAILVEPVVHSCGCLKPRDGYLEGLRELASSHGVVLIFDEVMTGFRHHQGGCQAVFRVTPDLTTFGKALSNGYAISGVTGKNEIMSRIAPEGDVFFSGTFNGHLLNVTAALRTQEILRDPSIYERLWKLGRMVEDGINNAVERLGVKARCESFGSVWSLYFGNREVRDYRDLIEVAYSKDDPVMRAYLSSLLNNGIYVQPFYVVRSFISAAHTEDDMQKTIDVTVRFLEENRIALS